MSKKEKSGLALRDSAMTIAQVGGRTVIDDNGTRTVEYRDARLRIRLTPPIVGSSNPAQLEVWRIGGGSSGGVRLTPPEEQTPSSGAVRHTEPEERDCRLVLSVLWNR